MKTPTVGGPGAGTSPPQKPAAPGFDEALRQELERQGVDRKPSKPAPQTFEDSPPPLPPPDPPKHNDEPIGP